MASRSHADDAAGQATRGAGPSAPLLDESQFRSYASVLSAADLEQLVAFWRAEMNAQIETIAAVLGDTATLSRLVHKISGAASSFGAARLAQAVEGLRGAPSADSLGDVRTTFHATVELLGERLRPSAFEPASR